MVKSRRRELQLDIMYRHVYIRIWKKKKKKKKLPTSPVCERIVLFSLICEEGKEKEKTLFFFSALRAVVHLEKAISEPAITI